MERMEINVDKVKCNGCAVNIKNGLAGMDEVNSVEVDVAIGKVSITGEGLDRESIASKLAELGYPETA